MKKLIMVSFLLASNLCAYAQNTFVAVIKDSETKEPLMGATVILSGTATGATADIEGIASLTNIPNGKQDIEFRYIGYERSEERRVGKRVDVRGGHTSNKSRQ